MQKLEDFNEYRTYKDLKNGDKYITDDEILGIHYVFQKIGDYSIKIHDGTITHITDDTPIRRIEI